MASNRPGPKFTFTIPASAKMSASDPDSVTFTTLTMEQDLDANKLLEKTKNIFDKIKMAIVAIDGKPVDWAGGGLDMAISAMSPKVRELLFAGFVKLHNAEKKETEDFLAGMKTEV